MSVVDGARTTTKPDLKRVAIEPKQACLPGDLVVKLRLKYVLHKYDDDTLVVIRSTVYNDTNVAPQFGPELNRNFCRYYSGIKCRLDKQVYVCPVLSFEVTCCFNIIGDLMF